MRILVTGAGGFVGRHFVAQARAAGHEALALSRTDAGFSPDWPAGPEAVVHLAALNPKRGEPASRDLAALRRANVEGTRELARRAAREGVPRMVFVGSAAVHGSSHGAEPVSETSPLAPESPYGVSKAEAEGAFRNALADGGTTGVVLRPVAVFGPGSGNMTGVLARLARTRLPLPLGGLGSPRSLVSVDGLADAILRSLTTAGAAGETFLVADDGPLTPAEIVAALRVGSGRSPMVLPGPVRLAAAAARLLGRNEAFRAATGGLVVDNRRIRDALGWQPADARKALAKMAADGRL